MERELHLVVLYLFVYSLFFSFCCQAGYYTSDFGAVFHFRLL